MPISSSEARASGSSLPFGFRVPTGATQIGPLLPCEVVPAFGQSGCPPYVGGHGTGPTEYAKAYTRRDQGGAVLAIDVGPSQVFDDLMSQARGLGFHGGARCKTLRLPPGNLFSCSGALRSSADRTRPDRTVIIELRYGVDHVLESGPLAVLTLQFVNGDVTSAPCEGTGCSTSLPVDRVRRPSFGQGLRPPDPFDRILGPSVRLLPGSEVVMNIAGDNTTNGNVVTVIKSPDPERAATRYVAAIARAPYVADTHDDGHHVDAGWKIHSWSFRGNGDHKGRSILSSRHVRPTSRS